ncbi:MAG TPA: FecR domain-containing protein [Steroidobacteraceae bacterium]
MSFRTDSEIRRDAALGEEAAEWLLRLEETDSDPHRESQDEKARNQAFWEWIQRSPEHLRVFLETVEVHRRMQLIDARHLIKVEALLAQRAAVIPLPLPRDRQSTAAPSAPAQEKKPVGRRAVLRAAAAVLVACLLGAGGYLWFTEPSAYTTGVGEQRSAKLEDGSFIYLNTDSKVEVAFSTAARNIRLVRGEALFVVEKDPSRPFTVSAGDATVRAVGTQFNVRRRDRGAEVAVIEGAVEVTVVEQAESPAQKLIAGEEAHVVHGKIEPRRRQAMEEVLAWRQRRLVFHDARLADVAEEFNRYNRTKIRIEGDAAREILLSGIFDADRPQALTLYAQTRADLVVIPEGDDWVIRSR